MSGVSIIDQLVIMLIVKIAMHSIIHCYRSRSINYAGIDTIELKNCLFSLINYSSDSGS